ncbi:MAG: hypothetical protein U0694_15410 [Anaerolineae bacterium]
MPNRDQQMFIDFAMLNTTLILAMILQTACSAASSPSSTAYCWVSP